MNDTVPQSALREWRHHMAQPVRATALSGAAAILALVGPFGTAEVMAALPRLAYWLGLVGASYSVGYAGDALARRLSPDRLMPRIVIAAGVTGPGVLALVYLLNGLALGYWPSGGDLVALALNVMAIAAILSVVFQVASTAEPATTGADDTAAPQPPGILERLPLDKRGALLSLSVEDHYVRVHTSRGEELLLLRLSDAMRETGDVPGAQVHRSHWVAWGAVQAARREGDRAILTLPGGREVPVSRAHLPKIREAGLLPR
ncbi:LytTR family DNA-binding domain-containing protein [Roseicyclus sp.]